MCFIGAPYPSILDRSDCTITLHVCGGSSHFTVFLSICYIQQFKEKIWIPTITMIMVMRTRFALTVGKSSPVTAPGTNTCTKMFAVSPCPGTQGHLGTLRHLIFLQLSCSKKTTRVSWRDTNAHILSINCFPLAFHHWLFNVRYRISQLLNLTNTEVYPLLSHCTVPGGINVCPTTDTDRVRLKVLLAAKNHGVNQISVPKTGSIIGLLLFLFNTFL